ncbi:MAG: formate dehydrogenase accessory sulfurtransferase FdhD [Bacteroidia bacterium]
MSKYQTQPHAIQTHLKRDEQWNQEYKSDLLAVEEPLEIRLKQGDQEWPVSVTMRTPGNDPELSAGFLFSEGLVREPHQLLGFHQQGSTGQTEALLGQTLVWELSSDCQVDPLTLERHFYTSSSCGVCGKSSIDAVKVACPIPVSAPLFSMGQNELAQLPERLRESQAAFEQTGGIHAAALFNEQGEILELREDVGRHNALDKLIGAAFLKGSIPILDRALLLSGRASFELIQKASMAGIQMVVAVGAPSSLAAELAEELNISLVGFTKSHRFNVYSAPERIRA